MKKLEKLKPIDRITFDSLSPIEKNQVFLQFQQEETMNWQKLAAKIFVIGFIIISIIVALYFVVTVLFADDIKEKKTYTLIKTHPSHYTVT